VKITVQALLFSSAHCSGKLPAGIQSIGHVIRHVNRGCGVLSTSLTYTGIFCTHYRELQPGSYMQDGLDLSVDN